MTGRPPRRATGRLAAANRYGVTTNSSMATIGWPFVPTTVIVSVWLALVFQDVRKSAAWALNEPRWRLTVFT